MEYRNATNEDSEGVALVLKECYNIDSVDEGKEVFDAEVGKGHHFIVAVEDGKIIGLTSWLRHGLEKHGLFELDRIAVLPSFRGKGVAKELVERLVKAASGVRKLYILTHADNKRAQTFYEKMGFVHETTLKEHYYAGKDEFVYSRLFNW